MTTDLKLIRGLAVTGVLTSLLAACGGGGGSITGGKSADWGKDACATFPAAAAAKASGLAIEKATGTTANANDTDVSSCSYATADGKGHFAIGLRHAHSGAQAVDQQIAGLTKDVGAAEDVPMGKGKALWSTDLRTLTWVPEPARMITVTPPGAFSFGSKAPPPDVKDKAIAIARAIEG